HLCGTCPRSAYAYAFWVSPRLILSSLYHNSSSSSVPLPQLLRSTLFPYTTLFRSALGRRGRDRCREREHLAVRRLADDDRPDPRSEEHTSELQSRFDLVCRLLLEKKNIG